MFKICAVIFRSCYSLTLSDPFGNLLRLSVEFKQFLVLNQFLSPFSCQILQCAVLPFYGTLKMEKNEIFINVKSNQNVYWSTVI